MAELVLPAADPLETAIDLLYQAVTDTSRWQPFLEAVCQALRARIAHFVIAMPRTSSSLFSMVWGAEPLELENHYDYMDQDARLPLMLGFPGKPLATHRDLGREVWHGCGMYRHFFARNGMDDSLVVACPLSEGIVVVLALVRHGSDPSFDGEELARFSLLVPHLRRAGVMVQRFLVLSAERWAALGALDQLALGVAVADREGHLLHANLMARRILEARDGVLVLHNQLWGNTPAVTRELRELIRHSVEAAGEGAGESGVLLLPRREGEPLVARVNSLGRNRILGREVVVGREVALLYLSDPDAPQEILTEHLQRLFGLTHREVALAAHLAKGRSLPQCQEVMGTSLNTLRSQLKSIFAKTGVSSQAALVRLIHAAPVWRLPPAVCRRHLRELAGEPQ